MQNNRFYIEEITADGSPTLRVKSSIDLNLSEQMHHSAGAASETIYIYGEAIRLAQNHWKAMQTSFAVVGLGLGYIEMLIALTTEFQFGKITSFEIENQLIENFKAWIKNPDVEGSVYSQALLKLAEKSNKSVDVIAFKNKILVCDIKFRGEVDALEVQNKKNQVICYDAFSKSTDSPLWEDSFLENFIENYCGDKCIFASYAKTGSLTRALKNKGFRLINKKGFAGKREATLATRGL